MRYWFLLGLFWLMLSTTAAQNTDDAVVLHLGRTNYPTTLDPLFAQTSVEAEYLTNLFIGLTKIDPMTGEVIPALAQSWQVSDDGLTWTFTLRQDVPWVRYDPTTNSVNEIRKVTASDALAAIQRMCGSRNNGYYATDVFARRIAGCAAGQAANGGTLVQASAPDDATLVITLTAPYADFLNLTSLWTMYPIPQEVINQFASDWTQPGNIVTSGAYTLAEAIPEEGRITLVSNPLYPQAIHGGGNITRIEFTPIQDDAMGFRQYNDGLLDRTGIPTAQLEAVFADDTYADQRLILPELAVFYFGIMTDKPPLDDVHVRRAFSAAFNRAAFIENVRQGRGIAISHFTPPGIAHAPPLDNPNSVGYNPDYAREQLAQSAYPNCEGLPPIEIVTYQNAGGWGNYLVDNLALELGCDPNNFTIRALNFNELRAAISPDLPVDQRPHLFTLSWQADYPDAGSFAQVLACGEQNRFMRACNTTDDLINAALLTADSAERTNLYAQIETAFFGIDGEFPLIPLFQSSLYVLIKPWFTGPFETDGQLGSVHYDYYTIDTDMRAAMLVCNISSDISVNLRSGPGTNFDRAGTLEPGNTVSAVGRTNGTDGFTWWLLQTGVWIREDVAIEDGQCNALPLIP